MLTIPNAGSCPKCGNSAAICEQEDTYLLRCEEPRCSEIRVLCLRPDDETLDPWIVIGAYHAEAIGREYRGDVKFAVWAEMMSLQAQAIGEDLSDDRVPEIWSSPPVRGVITLVKVETGV